MTYIITAQIEREIIHNTAKTPEEALYDILKTYFKDDFDTY